MPLLFYCPSASVLLPVDRTSTASASLASGAVPLAVGMAQAST